ncbi:hypothetical protein PoB_005068400 [Plakobranchus ocellatus]|uniref:XPG N-terminal domain-containing protein n=1 Tax=Plakobranchus ocellatus TaxID=259542 RepID=A0AAV4C0G8_9GAST|nr:hypothetical protein PoB_005068400 [Plakobranchus ocellatus]
MGIEPVFIFVGKPVAPPHIATDITVDNNKVGNRSDTIKECEEASLSKELHWLAYSYPREKLHKPIVWKDKNIIISLDWCFL